ncbi:MAG: mercuric transporter MerT family protein [Thermoanaerobaculia bacterium]
MTETRPARVWPLGLGALAAAAGPSLLWLCCLPLAAGLFGAGAAALGARLAPLRPVFSVIALLCLAAAFRFAYRREACEEGAACRLPGSRRRQRAALWAIAFITLLFLSVPLWSSWVIYWTS